MPKQIQSLTHPDAARANIPTAELEPVMREEDRSPIPVTYPRDTQGLDEEKARRNRDLDPQLVWRGKDEQDWSDLVVAAPPLYIQEKVRPKTLIDDLIRQTHRQDAAAGRPSEQLDLFADFNGFPEDVDKTEFYRHEGHWSNRMILGDSLQVMASLAEREGLRGKVQCIYMDPPYGIKFNSNFQWSTTSRDVKDGKADHITREPEQVKAFRDTWRDGIHSYLTYLRDRLTVARDLLTESGSVFVQIGDENVHRVRALMDEVFGSEKLLGFITFVKTGGQTDNRLAGVADYLLWYAKSESLVKFRQLYKIKQVGAEGGSKYTEIELNNGLRAPLSSYRDAKGNVPDGARIFRKDTITSQSPGTRYNVNKDGKTYRPEPGYWKTDQTRLSNLLRAQRLEPTAKKLSYVRYHDDFPVFALNNVWTDLGGVQSRADPKVYVVQSATSLIQRCILMTTHPGDLVLDPTCGSGTTAYVAEQWGRRWITIDTSRVALALARARLMGARYPYYLLADSPAGQQKEAEISRTAPASTPTRGNIRHGFVYERVPHITLKSIANNAEIDVIHEHWQPKVQDALTRLNLALRGHNTAYQIPTGGRQNQLIRFDAPESATNTLPSGETVPANALLDWEVPREAPADWPAAAAQPLADFWEARIARQRAIDASIAAKADSEYLYDKPYEDKQTVRVAGPFTVESLSPHRTLAVDENDNLIVQRFDRVADAPDRPAPGANEPDDFAQAMLEHLRVSGIQQAHKDDRISFSSITGWPGEFIAAVGSYSEASGQERRAGIVIGPEYGTIERADLVAAAREAADAGFDLLIVCAFNYGAHATEFEKLGRIPVLKARMNPELHMANDLANIGSGNLFVIFGEPDIDIQTIDQGPDAGHLQVKIKGVDVFHPQTGEVRADGPEGIACWFIDTDYNEESFFVRHAYFLGANDPYKALKTTLKAEIDPDAWDSLHSDTSRPFRKPKSRRIAVKVINHLGDEVMKVFRVQQRNKFNRSCPSCYLRGEKC